MSKKNEQNLDAEEQEKQAEEHESGRLGSFADRYAAGYEMLEDSQAFIKKALASRTASQPFSDVDLPDGSILRPLPSKGSSCLPRDDGTSFAKQGAYMSETELATYHPQTAQQMRPTTWSGLATYPPQQPPQQPAQQPAQPPAQQPAQQQPQQMAQQATPTADPMTQPNPANPLPINLGQGPAATGLDANHTDTRAAAMPGTPGHAATNTIDQHGGLDPRGLTVDGNNAAGVPKGFKIGAAIQTCVLGSGSA